jgi:DNA-binding protein HU-beta
VRNPNLVDTVIKNSGEVSADRKLIGNIVNSTFEVIASELKRQGKITCSSFGTFRVYKRKARDGRNPRTGESIKIEERKSIKFKPSKNLTKTL